MRTIGTLLLGVLFGSFASKTLAEPFKASFLPEHKANQVIVKYRSPFFTPDLKGATLLHAYDTGALLLEVPSSFDNDPEAFAEEILSDAGDEVEYIEPNYIIHISAVPNDPSLPKLWGLSSPSDIDIDAPEAWDVTKGSKKVVVGIIDTGIDCKHPDLAPNCAVNPGEMGLDATGKDKKTNKKDDDGNGLVDDWRGWDFVSDDNDPTDDQGHGTHVAGTIGAVGNNALGVAGVNWEVSMIALKFLDSSGSGSLDAAVRAIEYSTKLGVVVTNNSWGGGDFSKTMFEAIKKASDKGILFVAAAGNEANDNDQAASYPASYALPNVVSVAAIDSKNKLASFSNYGLKTVHLAAPGVNIYSTYLGNSYGSLSGTSMAAPHVTGAVALIKAANLKITAMDIKRKILTGVDKDPNLAKKVATGGRLNVNTAIRLR
jgi:subtilisin family serine protease